LTDFVASEFCAGGKTHHAMLPTRLPTYKRTVLANSEVQLVELYREIAQRFTGKSSRVTLRACRTTSHRLGKRTPLAKVANQDYVAGNRAAGDRHQLPVEGQVAIKEAVRFEVRQLLHRTAVEGKTPQVRRTCARVGDCD